MLLDKVFSFMVPKQKKFFPLFVEAANNLVDTAELIHKLLTINSEEQMLAIHKQVKDLERNGDRITKTLNAELNQTFITPFDREDINLITEKLDTIVDLLNSVSKKIKYYNITEFPQEFIKVSEIILLSCKEIQHVMQSVKSGSDFIKHYSSYEKIHTNENIVDDIYQEFLGRLFRERHDAIEIIKYRDVLNALEKSIDKTDDFAKLCTSISIKLG